jgi:hypothetical protein
MNRHVFLYVRRMHTEMEECTCSSHIKSETAWSLGTREREPSEGDNISTSLSSSVV